MHSLDSEIGNESLQGNVSICIGQLANLKTSTVLNACHLIPRPPRKLMEVHLNALYL